MNKLLPFVLSIIVCSSCLSQWVQTNYKFRQTISKKHLPLMISSIDDSSCSAKLQKARWAEDHGFYQDAYDSARSYIEECALQYQSWRAFNVAGGANGARNNENSRFAEFREWLKKVLYYNTIDSNYYCEDATEIIATFYWFNDERGRDIKGTMAVAKYLLESGKCPNDSSFLIARIANGRDLYKAIWQDTVKDSIKTPLDTTLPTLEELDLTILYGPSGVVTGEQPDRINSLSVTKNPISTGLELKYRLGKSAMIRIDIIDILGRPVYSEGQGLKAEGDHLLSLATSDWPPGSYYVRLSTPSGEVKSVKVIKE